MTRITTNRTLLRRLLPVACGLSLAVAGCTQGPDFTAPKLADGDNDIALPTRTRETGVAGGEAQSFLLGQDLPSEWWTLFASPDLNALIRRAIADSPDLHSAQAALNEAEQNLRSGRSALSPQVTGNLGGSRQLQGTGGNGAAASYYNVFNANVSVSYILDIFGAERRAIEGLAAQVDYEKYQLAGTYLTLTANIVTTAVQLASIEDQITATREIIASEQTALSLVSAQVAVGSAARAELLSARAQLETSQSALPALQKRLEITQHELTALIGGSSDRTPLVHLSLADLTLPQDLPLSLPSSLARQRPDIRAQEAILHAASAQIGVATANQYPQITLTGNAGAQSASFADLFGGDTLLLGLAGGLVQPLFDAGQREAARDAAKAAYAVAEAHYRSTVIHAFQNVADCLTALENDAEALQSTHAAMIDSKASLDLTQLRYSAGTVAYVTLLVQQQQYQQARIGYLQTLASRYADTAALFQALGGGWWHDPALNGGESATSD